MSAGNHRQPFIRLSILRVLDEFPNMHTVAIQERITTRFGLKPGISSLAAALQSMFTAGLLKTDHGLSEFGRPVTTYALTLAGAGKMAAEMQACSRLSK